MHVLIGQYSTIHHHNYTLVHPTTCIHPTTQLLDTADRRLQTSAELALERLHVTDVERNAILDAFRFADARHQRLNVVSLQLSVAGEDPAADHRRRIGPKALPHYAPEDVATLLRGMCVESIEVITTAGVTGGELLELSPDELVEEMGWSRLQVCCFWGW